MSLRCAVFQDSRNPGNVAQERGTYPTNYHSAAFAALNHVPGTSANTPAGDPIHPDSVGSVRGVVPFLPHATESVCQFDV